MCFRNLSPFIKRVKIYIYETHVKGWNVLIKKIIYFPFSFISLTVSLDPSLRSLHLIFQFFLPNPN
jgi:hypothetical protein